nr:hypothetical protein [Tanacetum cinerariifolium]
YPDVHPPSQEISEEVSQAREDLIKSIQTFLEEFNCIPSEEKPQILSQAWFKFFAIQQAQPEDSNELFQKLLKDLKELAEYENSLSRDRSNFLNDNENHSVQNEESLENSSNEIATSNSNQEKEKPPKDFDIRQLIREECGVKVCEEKKQKMEDTILNLVEIFAPILSTKEPEHSLSMGYEHLSIIPKTESNEVTESNAKNLLPIPSECEVTSEDESKCDMPAKDDSSPAFTTFSNPLFNNNDNLDSSDNNSLPDEDVLAEEFKVYSNPLFDDDEINSDKLDPYCFTVESDFVESLLNRDTFIDSSSKFDFSGELAHVNPEIKEANFDFEEEIHLSENLLYVNSSSRPPEEHNAKEERIKKEHADYISRMEMLFTINPRPRPMVNANTIIESLSSLPIPVQDGDSQREKINIITETDDVLPPSDENNDDSKEDIHFLKELLSDNSIPLTKDEASDSDHQDDPSFLRPPPEPPDAEFNVEFEKEISVVTNTIVEFKCLDPRNEFDNDYSSFKFVICSKMFISFLSTESEDTIFDPGISV